MCNNILIAFDGSAHSVQAARFSADMCGALPEVECTAISALTFSKDEARFHIIIGTRGLGNIQGALLGSVSCKVIQAAPCPVTLVRDAYSHSTENRL